METSIFEMLQGRSIAVSWSLRRLTSVEQKFLRFLVDGRGYYRIRREQWFKSAQHDDPAVSHQHSGQKLRAGSWGVRGYRRGRGISGISSTSVWGGRFSAYAKRAFFTNFPNSQDKYEVESTAYETSKLFLRDLLSEAFVSGSLAESTIVCCVNFLKGIVEHPDIPKDSSFSGHSLLILTFFLNPLANLSKITKDRGVDLQIPEELSEAISFSLLQITRLLPSGFEIETVSVEITKEFVEAMEAHWSILISGDLNCLNIYLALLRRDVRFQ